MGKNIKLISILSIIILGSIVYSNTFHSSFHFDDIGNLKDNVTIRDLHHMKDLWVFSQETRFVGFITFALNYHFTQYNVWSWHLVNLLIHLINALLVWWLVRLTLSTPVMKGNKIHKHKDIISLLAALLFVSHPIETQAVTYIVQRLASLGALFYLLSLCLYIQARMTTKHPFIRWSYFILFFLATILGMFTKEIMFTLPFMILLYEIFFLQSHSRKIKLKNPITIIGIIFFILLLSIIPYVFRNMGVFHPIAPEQGNLYSLTWQTYFLTQFRVITTYIRLLFIPVHQMLDYDYSISKHLFELKTFFSLLLLILIFISGIILYKKYRLISFAIFWFFLTLSVESGIIPIVNVIFEHRVYLPSVGFALFVTVTMYYLLYHRKPWVFFIILFGFIGMNSVLTFQRNITWKTDYSLWRDNALKTPHKARPWNNYGQALRSMDRQAEAMDAYNRSISINPKYELPYNNRGNVKKDLGDNIGAMADFDMATQLNPVMPEPYYNKGLVWNTLGQYDSAIYYFTKSVMLNPNLHVAYSDRGISRAMMGDMIGAINDFSKAIEVYPYFAEAYANRAIARSKMKDMDGACNDLKIALQLGFTAAKGMMQGNCK